MAEPTVTAKRNWLSLTSWVVLAALVAGMVFYAVRSSGFLAHRADLNDGGIWVTNSEDGLVGREIKPIKQLDVALSATTTKTSALDVLQSGNAVVVVDRSAQSLTPINTSLGTADSQQAVNVKDASLTAMGGGVLATADAAGRIWATQVSDADGVGSLADLDSTSKPLLKTDTKIALGVSSSGTIFALSSAEKKMWAISSSGSGFGRAVERGLAPAPTGDILQVTVVGSTPVWLDSTGTLGYAGHTVAVGEGAQLQQAGPDQSHVLVATPDGLQTVDLKTGDVTSVVEVQSQAASQPVSLGGCLWGLWTVAGTGLVSQRCGADTNTLPPFNVPADSVLVFRVNRNALIVNDLVHGLVWDVSGDEAEQVADWPALKPKKNQNNDDKKDTDPTEKAPPEAVKDELGGRAGATTVLHVLDNDRAPKDDILSITAVKNSNPQITVQVAPDQQTLLATINQGVTAGVFPFTYTIDDGEKRNATAHGVVELTARSAQDDGHGKPELRDSYTEKDAIVYPVSAGSTVDIPALVDWRDKTYGDPVVFVPGSATADKGSVTITPDGLLRFSAPKGESGPATISYQVTTGGEASPGKVDVTIYAAPDTAKPKAQPDVASAQVGSAFTVRPLDNDVPGADPIDPEAKLQLAGNVTSSAGLDVKTNLNTGVLTIEGSRPGTYLVPYDAKFGDAAAIDSNRMKISIVPSGQVSNEPIAIPDTTVVHGASPMTVDVIANDYDAKGRLLVVQHAEPVQANGQLSVAILNGRWLRVAARVGTLTPKTQQIKYTVGNGQAQSSTTLTVTQLPAIDSADNAPVAQPDEVTVRAGSNAVIPVLDNDSTPSGDPVGLVIDQAKPEDDSEWHAGMLTVTGQGTAYVDGRSVRFSAPSEITRPVDAYVVYPVENTADPNAGQASGQVTVHIVPPVSDKNPDRAPTPASLEGRVVQGDSVTLRLPPTGQDPDGDPVVVVGTGDPDTPNSVPTKGQVIAFSADSLTYQAFPGVTGSDQFTYTATDPSGKSSQGTVRVTIVKPEPPQAPVAVDDSVTAAPDRTLRIDVLANDLVPHGTTPVVKLMEPAPPGVSLSDGLIIVDPGSKGNQLPIGYSVGNGLQDSSARLLIRFQKDYDNPPAAGPVIAKATDGATTAQAKVLSQVSDLDDNQSDLKLVSVDGAPAGAIDGGTVTLPLGDNPTVWTYHVQDKSGAEAIGSIYVGGKASKSPYLKQGSVLRIPKGGSATVNIKDYVVVPRADHQPYLTTDDQIFAIPTDMFAAPISTPSQQSIKVTAAEDNGPAALVFQVTDSKNFNAAGTQSAMITLPVIVGDPVPQLNCPADPVSIPESATLTFDVQSVCQVWQDQTDPQPLRFSAAMGDAVAGVTAASDGGSVTIEAVHAKAGAQGSVKISIDGYDAAGATSVINFVVTKLPPPSMLPIPPLSAAAGDTATIDLAGFLRSDSLPADAFDPAVTSVTPLNGGPKASIDGTTVSVKPPQGEHQTYRYQVEMSDSGPDSSRPKATGILQVVVTDVPGQVTGVQVGSLVLSNKVQLHWTAPDNGGLPITKYVVDGGPKPFTCGSTTCMITGLDNGDYTFTVKAVNSLGESRKPSAPVQATADRIPDAVENLRVVKEADGIVKYQWTKPSGDYSPVEGYLVSYTGGGSYIPSTQPSFTANVPNGTPITFKVRAVNGLGAEKPGPVVQDSSGIASGRPDVPSLASLSGVNVAGGGTKAFTVSWGSVDPNGRGTSHYRVYMDGHATACNGNEWITATSCDIQVANDGSKHSFAVQAANDAGLSASPIWGSAESHQSAKSGAVSGVAAGTPDGISNLTLTATGVDGRATIAFDVGNSNGADNKITCTGGGGACGPWNVGVNGGHVTGTLTGLSNGATTTVSLVNCNGATEDSATDVHPCTSATTANVITFGPIGAPTITANASGTTITVHSSVNPNGRNVTARITSSAGGSQTCNLGGASPASCDWTQSGLNYSTTYTYTVTVTDASGEGRASKSASASARTADPNPTVAVARGGSHTGPGCSSSACEWVKTTTRDFTSTVNCSITAAYPDTGGFLPWSQGANSTNSRPNYYGWAGHSIQVTCVDGQGHSATGSTVW